MAINWNWQTIRNFSSQQAETAATVQGLATTTFVEVGLVKRIELRLRWGTETNPIATTAGGGTITGVTFAIWRRLVSGTETVHTDKLGTVQASISSNAVVVREPVVFEDVVADRLYASIESFTGGTGTLTVSGRVDIRVLQ